MEAQAVPCSALDLPALPGEVEYSPGRQLHRDVQRTGQLHQGQQLSAGQIMRLQQLTAGERANLAAVAQHTELFPGRAGADRRKHAVLSSGDGHHSYSFLVGSRQGGLQPDGKVGPVWPEGSAVQIQCDEVEGHKAASSLSIQQWGRGPGSGLAACVAGQSLVKAKRPPLATQSASSRWLSHT